MRISTKYWKPFHPESSQEKQSDHGLCDNDHGWQCAE